MSNSTQPQNSKTAAGLLKCYLCHRYVRNMSEHAFTCKPPNSSKWRLN